MLIASPDWTACGEADLNVNSLTRTSLAAFSPAGATGLEYGMSPKLWAVTAFEIRSALPPATFTTSWS